MIYVLLDLLAAILIASIVISVFVVATCGCYLRDLDRKAQRAYEREMAKRSPEPVHPDILERWGEYDMAKDRPVLTDDDWDAVRNACWSAPG